MFRRIVFIAAASLLLTAVNGKSEEINPVLGKTKDFILRETDLDRILANQSADVQKRFQEDPQQRANLVREILIKKAVVAKARKEGFDRKPEVREQLGYLIDGYLAQEYLQKVVTAGITVSEDDARKFYQENEKEFVNPEQIKVRHILINVAKDAAAVDKEKARVRAEQALQRLKKGEDFAALAKEYSDDQISSSQGGELAPITRGKTNSDEFEKAAFALKTGETSGIVTSDYGLHIIRLEQRQEAKPIPFADAREFIINRLKAEREQKKAQEFLEQAIKDAGMEISGEKGSTAAETSAKTPEGAKKDTPEK